MTEAELRLLAKALILLAADDEEAWTCYEDLGSVELMETFKPLAEAWLKQNPQKKKGKK